MKSKRNSILALVATIGAFVALPAAATPVVGTPTDGFGSTTPVGNTGADGTINFYIPLTDVFETYGVTGGTSSDTCSTGAGSCTGGALEMFLYFDAAHTGGTDVNLLFRDLDAAGVNDPWFFLEALIIYDDFGNLIDIIGTAADLSSGDRNSQTLDLNLTTSGGFYLQLIFFSGFANGTPGGTYTNTVETLLATAVAVPEPETLALLGLGLLLLGAHRRRKNTV